MRRFTAGLVILALAAGHGCVEERCVSNQDCPSPRICDPSGRCVYECSEDPDCGTGFTCEAHRCVPSQRREIECPPDMVLVSDLFCLDRYEASRPDATATSTGMNSTIAISAAGVLPWEVDDDNATAEAACVAAGKRLCTAFEWELACRGPEGTIYGYGPKYAPEACNGLDTFGPAGATLLPTGALPGCVNGWGAVDMNGNLWEHVADGNGESVRGGAYNCLDSMSLHRCDYIPRTWVPSALGFRCCLSPEGTRGLDPDVTGEGDVVVDVPAVDIPGTEGGGCLDPDTTPSWDVEVVVVPPECLGDEDCHHLLRGDDPCVAARCGPEGDCELAAAEDGEPCDDANPCTATDLCVGGVCEGGENLCECQTDGECPDDGDLCNGALECSTESVPFLCVLREGSVVECPPSENPCMQSMCKPATGLCVELPGPDGTSCDDGDPCTGADQCLDGTCAPGTLDLCACNADMVLVDGQFCMDRYEASRPDATAGHPGVDSTVATSAAGVIPWFPVLHPEAALACLAAGKRLCTEQELLLACGGTAGTSYLYGDDYSATICNGIDAFCNCDAPNCLGLSLCPYPHCYNMSPSGEYGMGCSAWFHVTPTGAFPGCVNEWGAYDINGNVWELVDTGTEESWYTGGAYNCGDSETLHQCGALFQGISAKGFRCCAELPGGLQ